MTDINKLVRRVHLASDNAPDFVIEEAVYDTVQQLCIDAEVWQALVDIDTSINDNEIIVTPPQGTIVVRTMWVTLGNGRLAPVDAMEYGTLTAFPKSGKPVKYFQQTPTELLVVPTPDRTEDGIARVVCALANGATRIPDEVYALYKEHIVNGALARVLASPASFGNQSLALTYEKKWYAALDMAKGRATRYRDNKVLEATYGGY